MIPTPISPRALVFAIGLMSVLASISGCSPAPLAEGDACATDEDCGSGSCVTFDSLRQCSTSCVGSDACPPAVDGSAQLCQWDGYCHAPCTFAGAREGRACREGIAVECATLDPVAACADCGCDAFGGGFCVAGRGCVLPQPPGGECGEDRLCASLLCDLSTSSCVAPALSGDACTIDRFCASGLCEPSTSRCVAAAADGDACSSDRFCVSRLCDSLTGRCTSGLAMGEGCESDRYCAAGLCGVTSHVCSEPGAIGDPCSADRECTTSNCSVDGNETLVGRCNQALGEMCDRTRCNLCRGEDPTFGIVGYCARNHCDPVDASCGPPVGPYNRVFTCKMSVDSSYSCYETCPTTEDESWRYNCLDRSDICHWQSGSCW